MSDQNEGYSLTFEELQDFIRQSGKNYNLELIEKAYSLAAAAHGEAEAALGGAVYYPSARRCQDSRRVGNGQ